jgi:Ca2+-binding RTX toxin-like protein
MGFEATAYRNGDEIVIAFAGTEFTDLTGDWLADITMGVGLASIHPQLMAAALFYETIKNNPSCQGATITFTGHSLGGGLAALMGVFFDEQAVTFDPAPFRLSATETTRTALAAFLWSRGFTDQDLLNFSSVTLWNPMTGLPISVTNIRGEQNVSAHAVTGEVLTNSLSNAARIYGGALHSIGHGNESMSGIALHSQSLLIALCPDAQGNNPFRDLTYDLPTMLVDLLDDKLFARGTINDPRPLIDHLIRHQFGYPGVAVADQMLDKFTTDLQKLIVGGVVTSQTDLQRGLMQAAMENYWWTTGVMTDQFFEGVTGGVEANLGDIFSNIEHLKGYRLLETGVLALALADVGYAGPLELSKRTVWYVSNSDATGLNATGEGTNDAILGGALADQLNGSGGSDLLIGGAGNDTLAGGDDNDTLIGGAGNDSLHGGQGSDKYYIGSGQDTVNDGDGQGLLLGPGGVNLFGSYIEQTDGSYVFADDAQITATKNGSTLTINLGGGNSVTIDNFDDGDLRISLEDLAETTPIDSPTTGFTISGDLQPIDADPLEPGVQYSYDALDNVVCDPEEPEPDRADLLYDSAGNDLILAGGGNDYIRGTRGGADRIEAGAGDDFVYAGAGTDYVLGDTGNDELWGEGEEDYLAGGAGDDQLNAGTGADWIEGGTGRDVLRGDPAGDPGAEDVLIAGADADILYGGGGDDTLYGDQVVALADAIADGQTAAGIAERGDFLQGLDGDDLTIGAAAKDLLGGGEGTDILVGGAGDDFLSGDGFYDNTDRDWSVTLETLTDPVTQAITYNFIIDGATYTGGVGAADSVYAGAGNDGVLAGGKDDHVTGEAGDDVLFGEAGADVLLGGDDADVLFGDNGTARLAEAFHGDDVLDGGGGNDTLNGNGGADALFGGAGNDRLDGDSGDIQTGGADYLDGEAGDDTLLGAGGDDTLLGGDDNDQEMARQLPASAPWRGEDPAGRTVLLHAEQGLGDTLQFVRYAPSVASRGARVVLECPQELARLLRRVRGVHEVIVSRGRRPPADLHCPLMSLPHVFGTT